MSNDSAANSDHAAASGWGTYLRWLVPIAFLVLVGWLVVRGIDEFNLPEMQVHLFMLYFACLSAVTPPVAVANFAAGAIAGVNPTALGPYAVKLAIGGFVVPFFFLFNPGLNAEGSVGSVSASSPYQERSTTPMTVRYCPRER